MLFFGIHSLNRYSAFFAGYSIDRVSELFLGRFETTVAAQTKLLTMGADKWAPPAALAAPPHRPGARCSQVPSAGAEDLRGGKPDPRTL